MEWLRKITAVVLCAALLAVTLMANTGAPATPEIYVDGRRTDLKGLSYLVDGTAYVPLREVSEALGATIVAWDPTIQTAQVEGRGITIAVTLGEKYMTVNGRYFYLPEGCGLREGACMVPVRYLAKAFGASVSWDGQACRVAVSRAGVPLLSGDQFYNADEVYWLSRIIEAEAGNQPLEGRIAVGNVILKRVESGEFPGTVKGVIFDTRSGVQFTPAYSGAIYNTPSETSVIAAKLALEGTDIAGESLYFAAAYLARSCWAGRNRERFGQIGDHVFFI